MRYLLLFLCLILPLKHVQAESTTISENLPLEVQVDLLMTELSRLLKIDDNQGVIELIPQIRSLDIDIPDSLHFLEARALYRTGKALEARDRLVVYLANTGREGRYYEQATELLLGVKEEAEIQERSRVEADRLRREELARSAEKARMLRIRDAQRYLAQLGFPDAIASGDFNKPTRIALATYQIMNDLKVNGDVTDETLEHLQSSVPDEDNCDGLARYSRNPQDFGIPLTQIPSQVAVSTCNEALRIYPEVIRFQIQYARSLAAAGRSKDALNAVEKAARLGYPAAETLVGKLHLRGQLSSDGKPDEQNALRWFKFAADRNYPEAMLLIGNMTEAGEGGIKRSVENAVTWFQKAADLGYPPAQVVIGEKHTTGKGLKRDPALALRWYMRAAEAGYPEAEFLVGEAYEKGRGVKRNRGSAIAWYRRAGNQGHAAASEKLKRLGG